MTNKWEQPDHSCACTEDTPTVYTHFAVFEPPATLENAYERGDWGLAIPQDLKATWITCGDCGGKV